MTFFQNVENKIISEFIIPIINDKTHFEFIYQEFAHHKKITHLRKWLYFKYLFEYQGEITISSKNPDLFSDYLIELFFKILKQIQNEQNQTQ
jgi:hypothetical protein